MRNIIICCLLYCNLSTYELTVAAVFRDEAPYLKEWVEYHHRVGVDHFLLYNNSSEDSWEEVLQPYIDKGLVEVFYWPSDRTLHRENQIKSYQDAVARAKGNSKWLALIDLDEFILPIQEKNLVECLEKHFSTASAVYVSWLMFGTSGVFLSPGEPLLPALTSCAQECHNMCRVGKTIVRPEKVNIEGICYPHCVPLFFDGHGYYKGNGEKLNYWSKELRVTKHYAKYLRINHYNLRDENFYHNVRIERAKKGIYGNVQLLKQYYVEFSFSEDYKMANFIKDNFPDMYSENR